MAWTEKCKGSFQKLKNLLCVEPVLRSPDFTKEFLLQTDASDVGVGAVLSQLDEEGADHPVVYYSRKLLTREQKYATIEKECLAIKFAAQVFRVYLLHNPDRRSSARMVGPTSREQCKALKVDRALHSNPSSSRSPSAWKGQRQRRLPFSTFDRMTSVEEKGEGMWRTELLIVYGVMGDFPSALLLFGAGRKRPALNVMGALLSVPHYCVDLYKCIELCIEVFLRSVALKLPYPVSEDILRVGPFDQSSQSYIRNMD